MQILGKLFGGEERVKVMRQFLFNPDMSFSSEQVAGRARIPMRVVEAEIDNLAKIKMIKDRKLIQAMVIRKKGKEKEIQKKVKVWQLNQNFEYLNPLRGLLINTELLRSEEILRRLHRTGKLKLVIVAGVFIQSSDSRVDILVVGDNLKRHSLERIIQAMESEIGKELAFAAFETADFQYRLSMYDKLICDILDYPHEKLLDRLNPKAEK